MEKEQFKIVFMGTPDFAVRILDELCIQKFNIVSVITAPDKPAGRGLKTVESPVKTFALSSNIPVLQPVNLKDDNFIAELESFHADLFVVVAFRMLPQSVWSLPPFGTINLHASLLPDYRGAAPINWAIINGEKETGVSTFFIEKEIDTGKIIEQKSVPIGENETVGELHDKLMEVGAAVTASTVMKIISGKAEAIDQSTLTKKALKPAPKIYKNDCQIRWSEEARKVHDFIRGLSPYPAAWCNLINEKGEIKSFKIFNSRLTDIKCQENSSLQADKDGILFPCADNFIRIIELQPEGKRRMNYRDFLAGNNIDSLRIIEN